MIQIPTFYEVIENNKVIGVCDGYEFARPLLQDNGLRYGIISEENYKLYGMQPWLEPISTSQFGRPILTKTEGADLFYMGSADDKNCCFAD